MAYGGRGEVQLAPDYATMLDEAAAAAATSIAKHRQVAGNRVDHRRILDPQIEAQGLLWFVLPSEVVSDVAISGGSGNSLGASAGSDAEHRDPGVVTLFPRVRKFACFVRHSAIAYCSAEV